MMYQSHMGSAFCPSGMFKSVTKMLSAYDAEKNTITAVVATYAMVSPTPVMNPPQGPIAARPNEYAPPVCGMAAAISPMLKINP